MLASLLISTANRLVYKNDAFFLMTAGGAGGEAGARARPREKAHGEAHQERGHRARQKGWGAGGAGKSSSRERCSGKIAVAAGGWGQAGRHRAGQAGRAGRGPTAAAARARNCRHLAASCRHRRPRHVSAAAARVPHHRIAPAVSTSIMLYSFFSAPAATWRCRKIAASTVPSAYTSRPTTLCLNSSVTAAAAAAGKGGKGGGCQDAGVGIRAGTQQEAG